ncbi:MAG: ATP-binding cassette domain-containing protein [Flavobacteriaceae bacterium]
MLKVENVSKQYRLGQFGTGTISHDLNRWWNKIRGKEDPFLKIGEVNDRSTKAESQFVWALKDINFEVHRGEVLGIIGKNGAGKSTLLKILSKVTGPTTGNIKSKGNIASLLEVGTGFHPEMTGRENIFLNGAILGMTKKEISNKLDEIIDFSGCERYVDTPVKRYSSGMKVRLAFAVAAHLEPDILVIDEVLAVGDAEFQKKAIGKMQSISKNDGRTVLFVSHNMAAIQSLCTRAILLNNGTIYHEGSVADVINKYQEISYSKTNQLSSNEIGNEYVSILFFDLKPSKGQFISKSSGLKFSLKFLNKVKDINLAVSLVLKNYEEVTITEIGCLISKDNDSKEGVYCVEGEIPPNTINAGNYYFNIIFGKNQKTVLLYHEELYSFEMINEASESSYSKTQGILSLQVDHKITYTEG